MKACLSVVAIAAVVGGTSSACAQPSGTAPQTTVVLVDSTGNVAARPLNETTMLLTVSPGVVAPAFIRPIYDAGQGMASGLATWASGGSVLYTSADCSTGPHIHTLTNAGVRATSQVETPGGIVLYIGAVGAPAAVEIHSILYGSGCSAVTVRQNGLVAVVATVNLTTTFPPPLSFQ